MLLVLRLIREGFEVRPFAVICIRFCCFHLLICGRTGLFSIFLFSAVFYELRDLPLICGDLSFLGNPSFSTIKCEGSHFPPRKYSIYRVALKRGFAQAEKSSEHLWTLCFRVLEDLALYVCGRSNLWLDAYLRT